MATCDYTRCLHTATRKIAYRTTTHDGDRYTDWTAELCDHHADAYHRPDLFPGVTITVTRDEPLAPIDPAGRGPTDHPNEEHR